MASQAPRGPTATERSPFWWADGPEGCGGNTLGFRGWSWGWGESPLCGVDTVLLGASGRPWILQVTSRGHWLCLFSGHLPAPTPGVSPPISLSLSLPLPLSQPFSTSPNTSILIAPPTSSAVFVAPGHQAPLGSWSPPSRPSRARAMRAGVLCSWEGKGSRSFAPRPVSSAPPPQGLPPTLRAAPRRARGRQTRTPRGAWGSGQPSASPRLRLSPGPKPHIPAASCGLPASSLSGPDKRPPL